MQTKKNLKKARRCFAIAEKFAAMYAMQPVLRPEHHSFGFLSLFIPLPEQEAIKPSGHVNTTDVKQLRCPCYLKPWRVVSAELLLCT